MTQGMFEDHEHDHDPTPEDPAICQYKRYMRESQDFRRAASWSDFRSFQDPKNSSSFSASFTREDPTETVVLPPRTVSMVVNPRDLVWNDDQESMQSSEQDRNECWDHLEQWSSVEDVRRSSGGSGQWFPKYRARNSFINVDDTPFIGQTSNLKKAVKRPSVSRLRDLAQVSPETVQLQALLAQQQPQFTPMPYLQQADMQFPPMTMQQLEAQQLQLQQQQQQLQLQQLQLQQLQQQHQQLQQQQQQQQQHQQSVVPQDYSPLQRRLRLKAQSHGPQVHFQDQVAWQESQQAQLADTSYVGPVTYGSVPVSNFSTLTNAQDSRLNVQPPLPQTNTMLSQQQHLQLLQLQHQQERQQQQQQQQQQQLNLQFQQQHHFMMQMSPDQMTLPSHPVHVPAPTTIPLQVSRQQPQYPDNHYTHPSPMPDPRRKERKQAKQEQRMEQRQSRAQKSQFPYPLIMGNEWRAFCREFSPDIDAEGNGQVMNQPKQVTPMPAHQIDPEARFLEIYLTVDEQVRKSNPVEVVLHGLIAFGPVEIIRTCTDKNVSKWQRRHQRTVLVQMFSAEAAQRAYECGTIEAGHCVMRITNPPQKCILHVTCENVCLFAYEVHRLSDADLLQILKKAVSGVHIMNAKKRVERSLLFDSVEEARTCIHVLQKPLLQNFNILLYAYSNGSEEQ